MLRVIHIIITFLIIGGVFVFSWFSENICKTIYLKAREYEDIKHYKTAAIAYEYAIIKYPFTISSYNSRKSLVNLIEKNIIPSRYPGSYREIKNKQQLFYPFPPYINPVLVFIYSVTSLIIFLCYPAQKYKLILICIIISSSFLYIAIYEFEAIISLVLVCLIIPFLFANNSYENHYPHTTRKRLIAALLSFIFAVSFFLFFLSPPSSSNLIGRINVDAANVRTGPGMNYDIIKVLKKGSKFEVLEKNGSWYKIKLSDGKKAWVYEQIIQVEEDLND